MGVARGGSLVKTCPYCAEQIQDAAVKCRYCGPALDTPDAKWREFRRTYDSLSDFEKSERRASMSPEQLAALDNVSRWRRRHHRLCPRTSFDGARETTESREWVASCFWHLAFSSLLSLLLLDPA
jgi:hypothetical protein